MADTDLRGNELETGELPPCLLVDDVLDLGVNLSERSVEDLVLLASVSVGGWMVNDGETHEIGGVCGGHRPEDETIGALERFCDGRMGQRASQ